MEDYPQRFGGIARLFGAAGSERLRHAHVCVVGIGGVGSWTVEALARSGIGHLTLVDLDDICLTNVNRQVHAVEHAIGRAKVDAMAERVRQINPHAHVHAIASFFTSESADEILAPNYAYVVDAIDNTSNKALLIARCRTRGLPVVATGGAGGRRDPAHIKVTDLAFTSHDRLLAQVRSALRQDHGFPREIEAFGIPCVYSTEPQVFPREDQTVCARTELDAALIDPRINCDSGFGTATFVTGTFGFLAASVVVTALAGTGAVGP